MQYTERSPILLWEIPWIKYFETPFALVHIYKCVIGIEGRYSHQRIVVLAILHFLLDKILPLAKVRLIMEENTIPRLSRLTAILTQLQSKKIVTAPALAEKFEVSIRTIYRDIRALEKSGVPIVVEEGKGYTLMDGYQLPPIMFSEQEANALITAEQLIQKNKDASFVHHYKGAILKIKALLKDSQKEKTNLLTDRIYFRDNYENHRTSDYLMNIQSAITSFEVLEINYTSLQNKESTRCIEPFALYSTQENWLLIAYCRLRKAFRAFRIDHIKEVKRTFEHFDSHNMTLLEYFQKYYEKYQDTPDTPLS